MYITVRTIISNGGEIDTDVKYYYDYEVAKTNLLMQKDILILELLIKYTKGKSSPDDFDINKYGKFTFTETLLEFVEDSGDYMIRYEIKHPLNQRIYDNGFNKFKSEYGLGAF